MVSDEQIAGLFREHYFYDGFEFCPQNPRSAAYREGLNWPCDCGADEENALLADVIAELLVLREKETTRGV